MPTVCSRILLPNPAGPPAAAETVQQRGNHTKMPGEVVVSERIEEIKCSFDDAAETDIEYESDLGIESEAIGAAKRETLLEKVPFCELWAEQSGLFVTK